MIFNNIYNADRAKLNIPDYTYTGKHNLIQDSEKDWHIEFLTDGVFTCKSDLVLDVHLVGGGGGGLLAYEPSYGAAGGGGFIETVKDYVVLANTPVQVTIGQGGEFKKITTEKTSGVASDGGKSFFGVLSVEGGKGGKVTAKNDFEYYYGGTGASGGAVCLIDVDPYEILGGFDGANGGIGGSNIYAFPGFGQEITTRDFGEFGGKMRSMGGNVYTKETPLLEGRDVLPPQANSGDGGHSWVNGEAYPEYCNGASGIIIIRNQGNLYWGETVQLPNGNKFLYNGRHEIIDDGSGNWRIKFYTSGNFQPIQDMEIDVFCVGGGGGGACTNDAVCAGGGSGYTITQKNIKLYKDEIYPIIIGAGGSGVYQASATNSSSTAATGGSTLFSSIEVNGGAGGRWTSLDDTTIFSTTTGGTGGSGGSSLSHIGDTLLGGIDGANGTAAKNSTDSNYIANAGAGQKITTKEFGEEEGELYSSGGGAYVDQLPSSWEKLNHGNGGYGCGGTIVANGQETALTLARGQNGVCIIRNARGG